MCAVDAILAFTARKTVNGRTDGYCSISIMRFYDGQLKPSIPLKATCS